MAGHKPALQAGFEPVTADAHASHALRVESDSESDSESEQEKESEQQTEQESAQHKTKILSAAVAVNNWSADAVTNRVDRVDKFASTCWQENPPEPVPKQRTTKSVSAAVAGNNWDGAVTNRVNRADKPADMRWQENTPEPEQGRTRTLSAAGDNWHDSAVTSRVNRADKPADMRWQENLAEPVPKQHTAKPVSAAVAVDNWDDAVDKCTESGDKCAAAEDDVGKNGSAAVDKCTRGSVDSHAVRQMLQRVTTARDVHRSQARDQLLALGVDAATATQLAQECSAEAITRWCAYVRRRNGLVNPAGFVVSRLMQGVAPPAEEVVAPKTWYTQEEYERFFYHGERARNDTYCDDAAA